MSDKERGRSGIGTSEWVTKRQEHAVGTRKRVRQKRTGVKDREEGLEKERRNWKRNEFIDKSQRTEGI